MSNRCKVCRHPQLEEINRELVMKWRTKGSFRDIARRFDLHRSSVYRHFCEHLPAELWRSEEARRELNADNLVDHLLLHYRRMEKLAEACERALEDPEDPCRWIVGCHPRAFAEARADQILVSYTVPIEGNTVRRKANLDVLLDLVLNADPEHPAIVNSVTYRAEDIVKSARETAREARGFLELYAKLVGQLVESTDVELIVKLVIEALRPHPEAVERVLAGLREAGAPGLN